jgi:hypothetical protein
LAVFDISTGFYRGGSSPAGKIRYTVVPPSPLPSLPTKGRDTLLTGYCVHIPV